MSSSSSLSASDERKPKNKTASSFKKRVAKAAANPARIIDSDEPVMIPQVEHRLRDRQEKRAQIQEAQRITAAAPVSVSDSYTFMGIDVPPWFGAKTFALCTLMVFFILLLLRHNTLIRKTSVFHALTLELPFLLYFVSDDDKKTIKDEIQAAINEQKPKSVEVAKDSPPPPQSQPTPLETKTATPPEVPQEQLPSSEPKVNERQETINLLVDEALAWAEEERMTTDSGSNEKSNQSEDDENEEEDTTKRQFVDINNEVLVRKPTVIVTSTVPKPNPTTNISDIEEIPGVTRGSAAKEKNAQINENPLPVSVESSSKKTVQGRVLQMDDDKSE